MSDDDDERTVINAAPLQEALVAATAIRPNSGMSRQPSVPDAAKTAAKKPTIRVKKKLASPSAGLRSGPPGEARAERAEPSGEAAAPRAPDKGDSPSGPRSAPGLPEKDKGDSPSASGARKALAEEPVERTAIMVVDPASLKPRETTPFIMPPQPPKPPPQMHAPPTGQYPYMPPPGYMHSGPPPVSGPPAAVVAATRGPGTKTWTAALIGAGVLVGVFGLMVSRGNGGDFVKTAGAFVDPGHARLSANATIAAKEVAQKDTTTPATPAPGSPSAKVAAGTNPTDAPVIDLDDNAAPRRPGAPIRPHAGKRGAGPTAPVAAAPTAAKPEASAAAPVAPAAPVISEKEAEEARQAKKLADEQLGNSL